MFKKLQSAVCYMIYCPSKEFDKVSLAIEDVQTEMNERFTWANYGLDLQPSDDQFHPNTESVLLRSYLLRDSPTALGMTLTDGDAWNALLIFRFLRWVSTKLPNARIRLNDAGGYFQWGGIELRNGWGYYDEQSAKAWERYLVDSGCWQGIDDEPARQEALQIDPLFALVPARDYADRREIKELGLSSDELDRLMIHEVADRIRFPWDKTEA